MCNLYSVTTPVDEIARLFDVSPRNNNLGNAQPLPAVFPKQCAPVVWQDEHGSRNLSMMEWGFSTPKISKKTGRPISPYAWNNARDAKVAKIPLWSESYHKRRCLVPASSFQESVGRAPATNVWFGLRDEKAARPAFAFAGIWRFVQNEMNDTAFNRNTFAIITTDANDIVRPIHPTRMPVIVPQETYDVWLHGTAEQAQSVLRPFASDCMRIVRKGVGLWSDPLD